MKEYILNDRIILATEKAYDLLYKEQGYLPVNSDLNSKITEKNMNSAEEVKTDKKDKKSK